MTVATYQLMLAFNDACVIHYTLKIYNFQSPDISFKLYVKHIAMEEEKKKEEKKTSFDFDKKINFKSKRKSKLNDL